MPDNNGKSAEKNGKNGEKTFEIRCPGCGAADSLVYIIAETRTYPLEAFPSPSNPERGTYRDRPISKDDKTTNRATACTNKPCRWVQASRPNTKDIVREKTQEVSNGA